LMRACLAMMLGYDQRVLFKVRVRILHLS
jgi:hypothetical protein